MRNIKKFPVTTQHVIVLIHPFFFLLSFFFCSTFFSHFLFFCHDARQLLGRYTISRDRRVTLTKLTQRDITLNESQRWSVFLWIWDGFRRFDRVDVGGTLFVQSFRFHFLCLLLLLHLIHTHTPPIQCSLKNSVTMRKKLDTRFPAVSIFAFPLQNFHLFAGSMYTTWRWKNNFADFDRMFLLFFFTF